MNRTESARPSKCNLALFISILAALAIVFSLLGQTLPLPWNLSIKAEEVVWDCAGDCRLIIDDGSSRLLVLNEQNQVNTILYSSFFNTDTMTYANAVPCEDGFYVLESASDGIFVTEDRIVKYNLNGEKQETVYVLPYDDSMPHVTYTNIYCIYLTDEGGFFVRRADNLVDAEFYCFDLFDKNDALPETPVRVIPNAALGEALLCMTYDQENDTLIASDIYGCIYQTVGSNPTQLLSDEYYRYEILGFEHTENGWSGVTLFDSEGTVFSCTPFLIVKSLLFWLAILVIGLNLPLLIIRKIRAVTRESRNNRQARLAGISVVVFVFILGVVLLYSNRLERNAVENEENVLCFTAEMMADSIGEDASLAMEAYHATGRIPDEIESRLCEQLSFVTESGREHNLSVTALLMDVTDGREIEYIASLDYNCQIGSAYNLDIELETDTVSPVTVNSFYGASLAAAAPVYDEKGDVVCYVTVFTDYVFLQGDQLKDILIIFFELLSAAISISFLLTEAHTWIKCFASYRRCRAEGDPGRLHALSRPLKFMLVAASTVLTSVSTLVAKDLLASTPDAGNYLLIILPATLSSFGRLIGTCLFYLFSRRFGKKRISLATSILSAAAYLATGYFVTKGRFAPYIICFALGTLLLGTAESAIGQMVSGTKGEASRRTHPVHAATADRIAASSLAGLAAGYAATLFDNAAVYVLAAALVIVLIMMLVIAMSGKQEAAWTEVSYAVPTTDGTKSGLHSAMRFLSVPDVWILIICIIFPLSLSTTYKSIIFPLFMEEKGFNKSFISTVSTSAYAIVFYMAPLIYKGGEKYGFKRMAVSCVCVAAFIYGLLFINGSTLWAVCALFFISIADKVNSPCWNKLWPDLAKKKNISVAHGDLAVSMMDKIFATVRSPLVGDLLNLGKSFTCAVIAGFCGLSAVVYNLFTHFRKNKERPNA